MLLPATFIFHFRSSNVGDRSLTWLLNWIKWQLLFCVGTHGTAWRFLQGRVIMGTGHQREALLVFLELNTTSCVHSLLLLKSTALGRSWVSRNSSKSLPYEYSCDIRVFCLIIVHYPKHIKMAFLTYLQLKMGKFVYQPIHYSIK